MFLVFSFLFFTGSIDRATSEENCQNLSNTVNYDDCRVKLIENHTNLEIECDTIRAYANNNWGNDVRKILMTLNFQTRTEISTVQNASFNCVQLMRMKVKGPPANKYDVVNPDLQVERITIQKVARLRDREMMSRTFVDYSEVNSFEFQFQFPSNAAMGFLRYNQSCLVDSLAKNTLALTKCVSEVRAFQFNSFPKKVNSMAYPLQVSTYASHVFDFTDFALVRGLNPTLRTFALQLFKFLPDKVGFPLLADLKIRELNLAFNNIPSVSQIFTREISSLKALYLNNANVEFIKDDAFNLTYNLEYLNLAGNHLLTNLSEVGLSHLKTLILSQSPKICKNIFGYNFPKLNSLDLSDNNNNLENDSDLKSIFQHFPNLQTLNLDRNNIGQLLDFSPPINRSQIYAVSLRENNIEPWNETKLDLSENNINLIIDLSKNNITFVSPKMLEDFSSVKRVILDDNPFDCRECVIDPFVNWLRKYDSAAPYKCAFPEEARNKIIIDLDIDSVLCIEKQFNWLINVYTPLIVFFVMVITVAGLVMRYRWHLRYFYHLFHARMIARKRKFAVEDEPSHHFDAFVSYSSMDDNWVVEQLIPHVEQEDPGLHLCIHDRDFLAGGVIMENIVECIDISRKSIFLISKSFIRSNWCKWELQMAQHKLFDDGNDVLILILLEELNNNEIPKTLKQLMSTRTYLMWPDPLNVPACKLFWSRLKQAIGQCHCMQSPNQLFIVDQ